MSRYPLLLIASLLMLLPVMTGIISYKKTFSNERVFFWFWVAFVFMEWTIPNISKILYFFSIYNVSSQSNNLWITGVAAIAFPTILIRVCMPEYISKKKETNYYFYLLLIIFSIVVESILFGVNHFNIFATIVGNILIIHLAFKSMINLSNRKDTKELPPIYYINFIIGCYQYLQSLEV